MRVSLGFCGILFCLAVDGTWVSAATTKTLISATVGQVGTQVVTSREVQIAGILDRWMSARENPQIENVQSKKKKKTEKDERESWYVAFPSDNFSKALTQVMLELVVVQEAQNFSVGHLAVEELGSWVGRAKADLGNWPKWRDLKVTQAELEQELSRHLRAKSFLKFKTESAGIQITDEEAQLYYEKNKVRFGNLPMAQFKDSIKQYLSQKKLEENLKDWFELLKRKYRVRYMAPPPV